MIELYKGNDIAIRFQIFDDEESEVDLSSARLTFVVKLKEGGGEDVIRKTSEDEDEIFVDPVENSICHIYIEPEDTGNLTPKEYVFELLVELPDGDGGWDRYTAVIDSFNIKDTVIGLEDDI